MIFNYAKYSFVVVHCLRGGERNLNPGLTLGLYSSNAFTQSKHILIVIDNSKSGWHFAVIMNMNDPIC